MITTRGLCCCPPEIGVKPMDEYMVAVTQIPPHLRVVQMTAETTGTKHNTVQQVNELSNYIKEETIKSLNDPNVKLQKFVDTPFFERQLELKLRQLTKGRVLLNESVANVIPKEALPKLEEYFKKDSKEITRQDLLSLRTEELTKILEMKTEDVHRIKLVSLGVKFKAI